MRFIAKKGEWFDEGTEALLLTHIGGEPPCGIFKGLHDGEVDEEVCCYDEFELIG